MAGGLKRLFRGLVSKGNPAQERWLPVDDQRNGYYNYRLMRFKADGDLVRYPDYIWSSAGYWAARGGLSVHLEEVAERLEGVIYSDILVLLNREDRRRCLERLVSPWEEQLQALVEKQILRMIEERDWRLAMPDRPIRIRVIGDGEPAMGGHPLGLEEGEFATALLPNSYLGTVKASRPLAEVFIRVPKDAGGQGGFASVGTFWDDQLAFTIGSHWLDNGQHPALPASALYTLHRFPGQEGLNHRLNADLADNYRLDRTTSAQGDTVTIQEVDGDRAVLEVMLIPADLQREEPAPRTGDDLGTLIPDVDIPAGGMTMIPEPEPEPSVIISRRSVMLQKIHFTGVMRGYRLDIGLDGTVSPISPNPASRFRVEDNQVFLEPLRRDVTLDGMPLQVGRRVPLDGLEHQIAFANVTVTYRTAGYAGDDRWPYLGEVTVPAEPVELAVGSTYRVGRDRRKCEISLPDRAVSENIMWHPNVRRDGAIRTRAGEVSVESFTTDSILVAGRHAEIDLRGSEPKVRALSQVCPVFLRRRDGALLRLIAREGATAQPLALGDDLLVGNTLFRVILPGPAAVPKHPTPPRQTNELPDPPSQEPPAPGGGGYDGVRPSLLDPPTADLDPPDAEIVDREEFHDIEELIEASAESREQITAPVPVEIEPEEPPPPRRYGDLPRALRQRISLHGLILQSISLEESLTVADG